MSFSRKLQAFAHDHVRLSQLFMICRQGGVIIASIVVARFLPVAEVGVLEMLLLCGYLLTFFWTEALLKGFLSRQEFQDDAVRSSSLIWLFLAGALLVMGVFLAAQQFLLPLLVDQQSLPGLGIFAIYQILIIPVWMAPFAGALKGFQVILLSMYVLIGPAFASWAGWNTMNDVNGVLIGWMSYALVGMAYLVVQMKWVPNPRLWMLLQKIWSVSWPLMLYAFSAGMARSFDSWLVARYFDESVFAVFRYGAREFPLVTALAAGVSISMIPLLHQASGVDQLKSRSLRLMHICIPVVAALMLLSPMLFVIVFGEAYRDSAVIFNIYLFLTLTQLVFPQSAFTAKGETRLLWHVSLAELVINVGASLLLFQWMGLPGIAWGTVIAFAFEKIVLLFLLKQKHGIDPAQLVRWGWWSFYAGVLILSFILSQWMH